MSGKDIVRILLKLGWQVKSQRGSHVKLISPKGEMTVVPVHANLDVRIGTLRSIEKQTGVKFDQISGTNKKKR